MQQPVTETEIFQLQPNGEWKCTIKIKDVRIHASGGCLRSLYSRYDACEVDLSQGAGRTICLDTHTCLPPTRG
jgi:hypothetical protein